jgi:hypothetical protein
MRSAARAERAATRAEWLDDSEAAMAIEASGREYQALLDSFGETDEVVIGEPIQHVGSVGRLAASYAGYD